MRAGNVDFVEINSTSTFQLGASDRAFINVDFYIDNSVVNNTITFYDLSGTPKYTKTITTPTQISIRSTQIGSIQFSDSNSYNILVIKQTVVGAPEEIVSLLTQSSITITPINSGLLKSGDTIDANITNSSVNANITNSSVNVAGSVDIGNTPNVNVSNAQISTQDVNLQSGQAIIKEVSNPITSRSKVVAGYQESVEYLNYGSSGTFISGSSADSSENELLGAFAGTQLYSATSGGSGEYTIASKIVPSSNSYLGMIQFVPSASWNYETQGTPVVTVRVGLYDASFNLIQDYGQLSVFVPYQFSTNGYIFCTVLIGDAANLLLGGSTYWIVVSNFNLNGTIVQTMNVQTTVGSGSGYSTTNYTTMPSSITLTTNATGGFGNSAAAVLYFTSGSVWLMSSATINLTYQLGIVNTSTINGQEVVHFGIVSSSPQQAAAISGITLTTKGLTAGTIRTSTPPNTQQLSQAEVFVSDAGSTNSVTLSSGDTLQITLSFTLWGCGYGSISFDNLNGVSYAVLPLQ